MTRPQHTWLLLTFVLALGLAGCSPSTEDQLIGQWEDTSTKEIIEFQHEGELTISVPTDQRSPLMLSNQIEGSWQVLDDGRLEIEAGFIFNVTLVGEVEFDDDTFTYTYTDANGNEQESRYLRLKATD